MDRNNSGGSSNNDDINHNQLSALLNGGDRIADTQTGGHDGTDDARSIIIGIYTVILPTLVELRALIADQSLGVPTGWGQSFYHTSTTAPGSTHARTTLQSLTSSRTSADNENARVAFQVISSVTLPTLTPITDQTYVVDQDVTFTLPVSTGSASPFTYTLTPAANIPDGLVFTPADRTLAGAPTAAATALTYTVTDSAGNTASQTFSVTITEPLLFDGTIENQLYVVGDTVDLTLPEATGGMTPYSYTLLRKNAIVPPATGLTFDPDNRTLKGTAAVVFAEGTKPAAVLVYTVTDSSSPPASAALTFTAKINAAPVVSLVLTPASISENGGVSTFTATLSPATSGITTVTITATPGTGNIEMGILTLPTLQVATTATLSAASDIATDNPPAGVDEFALTIDIALNVPLPVNEIATVCLPTTGVPAGRTPVLYHYTSGAWNEIGREITTRGSIDYVCGDTATFSPFGVGYVVAEVTATRLHEQILSRVSQTVTAGTLAAVGARVDAAAHAAGAGVSANAAAPTLAYQLGGQSSMRDLLQAHGKSMLEGEMEVEQLLDGASFIIPLSATGDQSAGHAFGALSVWGGIDYRNLSSDEGGLDWDGGVSSFHFGIDGLVGDTVLAGVALSANRADFNYESTVDAATGTGEYQYHSTNINPYLGWFPSKNVKLWASAGFGNGEVVLDEVVNERETGGKYVTDTSQSSFTGGFSARLLRANSLTLYIKGDATQSKVELDEAEGIMQQEVNSRRTRLLLSGEQQLKLASGGAMTPSLEVGARSDGGDGVTGSGMEFGTGLHYTNPDGNLVVSGNVRTLLAHDYDEWGADVNVRILPPSGRGLSLSVNPVWGKAQSAAERLWDDGANGVVGDSGDGELQSSLAAEVGYGVAATMLGAPGLMTPYLGMSTDEVGIGRVRLGGRFADGNGLSLNLEGAQGNTVDGVNHTVLLRGELAF